jgi:hypothetical protein
MSKTNQRWKQNGAGADPAEFCGVGPIHKHPHD